jgi:hypothetical protein
MGENSSAWEPWGDGLPNQREVAVDQSQDAEADHPDGKGCQCRLLASGHRIATY